MIVGKEIPCVLIDFAPLLIFSSTSRHSFRVHAVASQNASQPTPSAVSFQIILLASLVKLISPRVYHCPLLRVS